MIQGAATAVKARLPESDGTGPFEGKRGNVEPSTNSVLSSAILNATENPELSSPSTALHWYVSVGKSPGGKGD